MLQWLRLPCDLNSRDFDDDEKAVLIANKDTIEKLLEVTMTYTINKDVGYRDEIAAVRKMKENGLHFLKIFKEEYDKIKLK